MKYLMIVERGPRNLSADFPDVPGCGTTGLTLEEVEHNAQEALALHFSDGDPLPPARSLPEILADKELLPLDGTEILTWIDFEQASHQLATA